MSSSVSSPPRRPGGEKSSGSSRSPLGLSLLGLVVLVMVVVMVVVVVEGVVEVVVVVEAGESGVVDQLCSWCCLLCW